MRLGIFGGTFDPIHLGHLRAAEEVADRLSLDRVFFIPAGNPPHRKNPGVSSSHRLAMVRLAVARNPRFRVLDLEVKRPGKSFTLDTLRILAQQHPQAHRFLIIGADQSLTLERWRGAEQLTDYCRLVVMTRPGISLADLKLPGHQDWLRRGLLQYLSIPALEISSTAIRQKLRSRQSIRYWVPEPVYRYIQKQALYLA